MGFAAPQGEPCSGRYDRRDRGLQSRIVRSIRALVARAFWSVAVPLDPQQLTKMHGECRMVGRTRRCEGVSAWVAIAPAAEVYGRRAVAQQGERALSSEVGLVQLRGHDSREGGEMAFHTQRGHEVPDGTKSCTYCGAPIVGGPAAGGRGDARDGRHRDVARRHGRPLRCDDCGSHRGDDSGIDRGPTAAESPATAAPSTSDAEETPATTEAAPSTPVSADPAASPKSAGRVSRRAAHRPSRRSGELVPKRTGSPCVSNRQASSR